MENKIIYVIVKFDKDNNFVLLGRYNSLENARSNIPKSDGLYFDGRKYSIIPLDLIDG